MNESSALTTSDSGHVFSGIQAFEAANRMAKALSSSALVPQIYQGQQGLANSLIALELANRMKISPLTVMQNMTPINGRPTWSSSFLIGTVNACGRFSPLRFVFNNPDEPTSCYAEANDLATGEVLRGEKITIEMAKAEGWYGRSGSKWKTFPGQMLRYRAGAFWARVYCPEISLGITTKEEAIDVETVEVSVAEPAPVVEVIEAEAQPSEPMVAVEPGSMAIAAMEAIKSATEQAILEKYVARAVKLSSEGKITEQEHKEILNAIEARAQELAVVPEPEPIDDPAPPAPSSAPEPAGDTPDSPALALKRKQALFQSLKGNPKTPAIVAAFCEEFGINPEAPFPQAVKTEAHAQFIEAQLA